MSATVSTLACHYAIIRFLPDAATGEFANVGVVLACPATGYFGARVMPTTRTVRIIGFFGPLDERVYREAMAYLQADLDRLSNSVRERGAMEQTFAELVRPRNGLLRFGKARAILAEQPVSALNNLFETMVETGVSETKKAPAEAGSHCGKVVA